MPHFHHFCTSIPVNLDSSGGKYDLSFDPAEPERYRKDVPKADVHILDAGHFALDAAADQIAALVQGFVGSSREGFAARRAR